MNTSTRMEDDVRELEILLSNLEHAQVAAIHADSLAYDFGVSENYDGNVSDELSAARDALTSATELMREACSAIGAAIDTAKHYQQVAWEEEQATDPEYASY